jgi:hypothetical protein
MLVILQINWAKNWKKSVKLFNRYGKEKERYRNLKRRTEDRHEWRATSRDRYILLIILMKKLKKSIKLFKRYSKEKERYGDLKRRAEDRQEWRVWLPAVWQNTEEEDSSFTRGCP